MKAIVADDSKVMRSIIEKAVKSLGYDVLHASNGQEVLDLLEEGCADVSLILLDWNMPVLNGFEALSQIKKGDHRDIPVLMVSTESEDVKVEQALKAGAQGYVSKPFTLEALAGAIQKAKEARGRGV